MTAQRVKPLFSFMRLIRFFFRLLYHPFAFTYDLVAATVSLGRWRDWVLSVVPFIEGRRVLEIGHGPGHLQRVILDRGLFAVAIDESAQMGYLAKRNTDSLARLTRGLAQRLPFPNQCFDTIVSTFPSDYIFDQETMLEAQRCLSDGGRFIVLPVAMITGRGVLEKLMSFLFRITGQIPKDPFDEVKRRLIEPFEKAGFDVKVEEVEVKLSLLLIVIATK